MIAAPPRARGSTYETLEMLKEQGGSPACAGIDLNDAIILISKYGLPRVRGDRPELVERTYRLEEAPPRARGSTHRRHLLRQPQEGSPACAGIDPF